MSLRTVLTKKVRHCPHSSWEYFQNRDNCIIFWSFLTKKCICAFLLTTCYLVSWMENEVFSFEVKRTESEIFKKTKIFFYITFQLSLQQLFVFQWKLMESNIWIFLFCDLICSLSLNTCSPLLMVTVLYKQKVICKSSQSWS